MMGFATTPARPRKGHRHGVLYSAGPPADDAREVLADLADGGHVPPELLARLEFVEWSGEYKDLTFVPDVTPAEVLLVDDDPGWVRPDQRGQWVEIAGWDGGPDSELSRIQARLCELTGGKPGLSD